ncbi:MAG: DUF3108 domain-containing protein [Campylobacterales bacterium]|nr:DUF3108 domain-containing protein [Campylobacterales bacterium]
MKKSLILFILYTLIGFGFLDAKTIEAQYKVSFGIVGELGIADAKITTEKNRYTIEIGAEATGLAKILSNSRKEKHISKGHIKNGRFISESYHVIKSFGNKYVEKIYTVDHKNKKVTKQYIKKKGDKVTEDQKSTLDFYAEDDLLSLYFNLGNLIKDKTLAKEYQFKTVGAEKQKGRVTVIVPPKDEIPKYKKMLLKGDYWYISVIIYQKIFTSKQGELLIAIDDEGMAQKAILKDLLLFGDLRGERIK